MANNGYYMATIGGKEIRVAIKYLAKILLLVGFDIGFAAGIRIKTYWIRHRHDSRRSLSRPFVTFCNKNNIVFVHFVTIEKIFLGG